MGCGHVRKKVCAYFALENLAALGSVISLDITRDHKSALCAPGSALGTVPSAVPSAGLEPATRGLGNRCSIL